MGLSCSDFRRKSHFFYTPVCFTPPLQEFPLDFGIKITGMTGLPPEKEVWRYLQPSIYKYTNVTDRRTDTGRQQRPRLRIASRGNIQRCQIPSRFAHFVNFSVGGRTIDLLVAKSHDLLIRGYSEWLVLCTKSLYRHSVLVLVTFIWSWISQIEYRLSRRLSSLFSLLYSITSIMYCRHATAHWDRSDQSCRLCHHTR